MQDGGHRLTWDRRGPVISETQAGTNHGSGGAQEETGTVRASEIIWSISEESCEESVSNLANAFESVERMPSGVCLASSGDVRSLQAIARIKSSSSSSF